MPNSQKAFLTKLTSAEMKKLLVARERIDVLLADREKLTKALNRIDAELSKLMDGAGPAKPKTRGRKKAGSGKKASGRKASGKKASKKAPAGKKVTRKKVGKKKAAKKKVTKKTAKAPVKRVASKVTRKKTTKKNVAKKTTSRTAAKASGRVKLEDVVVKVIKAHGGPMSYKELIKIIVKKKLFVSKSSNFDNVLRRTLSTSKLVKRAGRGIYAVA